MTSKSDKPEHVDDRLNLTLKAGWGVGSLAMSAMFTGVSILFLRYLVDYAAISASLAGLLIAVSKIYDAVTDPVMGVFSDRTETRWGRRRPYLLLGGVVCALSFFMMFSVPNLDSEALKVGYVLLALVLNATGYTLFNVPYLAMPAEMTESFKERTSLMSFRVGFVAIGQFLASVVGPLLLVYFGGGVAGHSVMAGVLSSIILASCVVAFWSTRNAKQTSSTRSAQVISKEFLKTLGENRPFLILSFTKLFQLIGTALFLGILPFFFDRVIVQSNASLSLFFLILTVCILVSQPFWVYVSNRFSKKISYYLAAGAYSLSSLSWLLAGQGEPAAFIVLRALVAGIGSGGLLLIGQALLPETIEYDSRRTGLRREAIYSGLFTFVEKSAFSIGAAVTGIYLGSMGYIAGTGVDGVQPEEVIEAVRLSVILPPIFFILSSLTIKFYSLTEEYVKSVEVRGY